MTETHQTNAHYLDASALMQLVSSTDRTFPLRDFFQANLHFVASSIELAKAISVLRERRKTNRGAGLGKVFADEYFAAIRCLLISAWGKHIELDEVALFDPALHALVEQLAAKHQLPFQDALQLALLKKHAAGAEATLRAVLITALDGPLAAAARQEGIPVWNCAAERTPHWDH